MTEPANNLSRHDRALMEERRSMQRMGMPGSRAYERAVREAEAATWPLVKLICDVTMIHGTPRVLIDAAGVVTVETLLPPEIQQRVDSMAEAVQGIRDSIFKAAQDQRPPMKSKRVSPEWCEAHALEGRTGIKRSTPEWFVVSNARISCDQTNK